MHGQGAHAKGLMGFELRLRVVGEGGAGSCRQVGADRRRHHLEKVLLSRRDGAKVTRRRVILRHKGIDLV